MMCKEVSLQLAVVNALGLEKKDYGDDSFSFVGLDGGGLIRRTCTGATHLMGCEHRAL